MQQTSRLSTMSSSTTSSPSSPPLLPFPVAYYRDVWRKRFRLISWLAVSSLIVVLRIDVVLALSIVQLFADDSRPVFRGYSDHETSFTVVFDLAPATTTPATATRLDDTRYDLRDILGREKLIDILVGLMTTIQLLQHGFSRLLRRDPSICSSLLTLPMLLVIAFPPVPSLCWVVGAILMISVWPTTEHLSLLFGYSYAACSPFFLFLFSVLPNLAKLYVALSRPGGAYRRNATWLPVDLLSTLCFYTAVLLIVLPFFFDTLLPLKAHPHNRYRGGGTFFQSLVNLTGATARNRAANLFRLSVWLDRGAFVAIAVVELRFSLTYDLALLWLVYSLSGFLSTAFWRLCCRDDGSATRDRNDLALWARHYRRLNRTHHGTVLVCLPICVLGHLLLALLWLVDQDLWKSVLLFAGAACCGLCETVLAAISAIEHNQFMDTVMFTTKTTIHVHVRQRKNVALCWRRVATSRHPALTHYLLIAGWLMLPHHRAWTLSLASGLFALLAWRGFFRYYRRHGCRLAGDRVSCCRDG